MEHEPAGPVRGGIDSAPMPAGAGVTPGILDPANVTTEFLNSGRASPRAAAKRASPAATALDAPQAGGNASRETPLHIREASQRRAIIRLRSIPDATASAEPSGRECLTSGCVRLNCSCATTRLPRCRPRDPKRGPGNPMPRHTERHRSARRGADPCRFAATAKARTPATSLVSPIRGVNGGSPARAYKHQRGYLVSSTGCCSRVSFPGLRVT
jgi:hypothetical protein